MLLRASAAGHWPMHMQAIARCSSPLCHAASHVADSSTGGRRHGIACAASTSDTPHASTPPPPLRPTRQPHAQLREEQQQQPSQQQQQRQECKLAGGDEQVGRSAAAEAGTSSSTSTAAPFRTVQRARGPPSATTRKAPTDVADAPVQPETPSSHAPPRTARPGRTNASASAAYSPADSPAAAAAASSPAAPLPPLPASDEQQLLVSYRLTASQLAQLRSYLAHLLHVNQSMNLTAVREPDDAWQRHIVDSLALLPVIERHCPASVSPAAAAAAAASGSAQPGGVQQDAAGPVAQAGAQGGAEGPTRAEAESKAALRSSSIRRGGGAAGGGDNGGGGGATVFRLIDVGTGAGLPGMVLAAARPHWRVTLLDSLRKRCDFLREAAAVAGLSNVDVVWCRAEEGGRRPELRQAYDLAVARAVAETRVLAELCLPFVRRGGTWVAAKGPDPQEEVSAAANAIRQLGGRQVALETVESSSAEGDRPFTALVVAKVGPTPPSLPRAPGTPAKKPL